jgi:hypothetical protein
LPEALVQVRVWAWLVDANAKNKAVAVKMRNTKNMARPLPLLGKPPKLLTWKHVAPLIMA